MLRARKFEERLVTSVVEGFQLRPDTAPSRPLIPPPPFPPNAPHSAVDAVADAHQGHALVFATTAFHADLSALLPHP